MKSLFNDNWRFESDAGVIDNRISKHIEPLFQEYVEKGFSPREISHLIILTILQIELACVLSKR